MNDSITSLLGLKDSDVLNCYEVVRNDVHHFYVTLVNRGGRCQECGTFVTRIKEYRDKSINLAIFLNEKSVIHYHARRLVCPKCGSTFFEDNPFINDYPFTSPKTIENVLKLLKNYNETFSSVARLTYLSTTQVINIFDEHVQLPRNTLTESICIDEFYFSRHARKKYAVMIISFNKGTVLDVLKTREKKTLSSYFYSIPKEERDRVKYVSIDMNDVYRDVVHTYFPKALLCIDSFHVIKNLYKALDEVRIRILKKYDGNHKSNEYYLLKYKKHLLYVDIKPDNYTKVKTNHHFKYKVSDSRQREMMLAIDPQLNKAYLLKEDYSYFNETFDDIHSKEEELNRLIDEFIMSGIAEMVNFGNTLQNWKSGILNSFNQVNNTKTRFHTKEDLRRISNGPIEGRNKTVKTLLKLANGYSNFERFRNRVLYVMNKFAAPSETKMKNTIKNKTPKEKK